MASPIRERALLFQALLKYSMYKITLWKSLDDWTAELVTIVGNIANKEEFDFVSLSFYYTVADPGFRRGGCGALLLCHFLPKLHAI